MGENAFPTVFCISLKQFDNVIVAPQLRDRILEDKRFLFFKKKKIKRWCIDIILLVSIVFKQYFI